MTVKRFGPVLGWGVQVEEKEAEQTINPAPYGVTVFVGEFERGEKDVPAFLSGKIDFARRNGGRITTSDCPAAVQDFFKLARGAGEAITHRVTSGEEKEAALTLYTRQGVTAAGSSSPTKGYVLGSILGPWSLVHNGTLVGAVDHTALDTATIAAIAATLQNGADETFALADHQTLTVKIDRGPVQTVEFLAGEFANIALATAEEVAAVIAAKLSGASVTVTAGGLRVTITSDCKGTDSYIEVTGGTANAALLFPIVETATTASNVEDVTAVTAAELKTILELAWNNSAGITVSSSGGYLRIETNLAGSSGYLQVDASSTLDGTIGLDNVEHQGTDGTAAALSSGRKVLGTLTAKSGGNWGGRRRCYLGEITGAGDLTETTIDTGDAMVENEWAGGTLQLKKVTTKTYVITGNTAAGVISVSGDQTLLTDWTAGAGAPALRYVLTKANVDHLGADDHLAVEVGNGEEHPTTEFSLKIYLDGALLGRGWNNLSTDPTKSNYWVNVVNNDPSNREVTAADLYTGDKTVAAVRPANFHGLSKTLVALTLTLPDPDAVVNSPTSANPTVAFTKGSLVRSQVLTGTVQPGAADVIWTTSLGSLAYTQAAFNGVATGLGDEIGTVTVTNGGTPLAAGDTVVLTILTLEPDELKGGRVWPSVVAKPKLSFVIDSNTRTALSVRTGLDLTDGATIVAGTPFTVSYRQEFEGACDSPPVSDADFLLAFDANLSPLKRIFGKNKGLVKVCTPGVTSTTVQKAAIEFAAAMNWGYRVEIPAGTLTEADAIAYVNDTIGRSEYASVRFPSYGSTLDPDATPGAYDVPLKQRSLTGMILGREALVAYQYQGYHKAPVGIDVTLPDVLELPTGNPDEQQPLDEEQLNSVGIGVVKFRQGNAIVMGDRTMSPTSEWKWYHQRCLMSHYENLIRENFDWIVFAVNDSTAWQRLGVAFRAFFLPEWTKGAIRGDSFDEAFEFKADSENNTDATMAAGDLNAELRLRLADTVERAKIVVGKMGIFDAVE